MGYTDSKLASFVSRGFDRLHDLDHFVATTEAQKRDIFRLRYDAYFSEGLIAENDDGVLVDRYDLEDSSVILGVTRNGQLVSTIRLNILTGCRRSSVSYDAFSDHLDTILDRGETIVDGTRMAVLCSDRIARRGVLLYTLSLTAIFAATRMVDHGAIAVRANHVPFYERYGFEVVGEPRLYQGMLSPRTLMMIRLDQPGEQSPFLSELRSRDFGVPSVTSRLM